MSGPSPTELEHWSDVVVVCCSSCFYHHHILDLPLVVATLGWARPNGDPSGPLRELSERDVEQGGDAELGQWSEGLRGEKAPKARIRSSGLLSLNHPFSLSLLSLTLHYPLSNSLAFFLSQFPSIASESCLITSCQQLRWLHLHTDKHSNITPLSSHLLSQFSPVGGAVSLTFPPCRLCVTFHRSRA